MLLFDHITLLLTNLHPKQTGIIANV